MRSAYLGCLLLWLNGCAEKNLKVEHQACGPWCLVEVTDVGNANLSDVWGDGKHLWIVGQNGIVVHFDGTAWHTSQVSSHNIVAVTGNKNGQIFAVGEAGTVLKWHDGQFHKLPTPQYSQYNFTAITASLDGVWIIGHSADYSEPETIVVRLKDNQFQTVWQPEEQNRAPFLTGLCVTEQGRAFAVGGTGEEPDPLLLSGTGRLDIIPDGLTGLPSGCASYGSTVAIIDREGMDVTLILDNETRIIGANASTGEGQAIFQAGSTSAMWLSGERSGFAVADAIVVFDDNGYESFSASGLLHDVHGTAPNNVYAVGESGLLMQFNGTRWHTISVVKETLRAIWVSSQYTVAVGDKGTILLNSENHL